jgi:hypothetical protein
VGPINRIAGNEEMTWIKGIRLLNVRFGSLADICSANGYVRFAPNSDGKSRHRGAGVFQNQAVFSPSTNSQAVVAQQLYQPRTSKRGSIL